MIGCPLLLAGVILLTGCSKDSGEEPVPEQKQVITFSGRLQEETTVTRAGLEEVIDNKTFQVWGYKNTSYDATQSYTSYQAVMPDFTVNWIANTAYTTTTNTNDWEYVGQGATPEQQANQTIKYWDMSANAYRFFGYAIGNATADPATQPASVTTATTANAVTFSAFVDGSTQAAFDAAPYFSELWFSTGDATTYPDKQFGQPVTLRFMKPYARVRFMFIFAEGINVDRSKLNAIEFRPTNGSTIATAGTVTVSYPLTGTATTETWTTTSVTSYIPKFTIDYYDDNASYTPTDTSDPTVYDNTPQKWYTVLPQSLGTFTVSVQVVTTDAKTAVVPAEYMDWKAGYEYTYKFKITEAGGVTLDIIQVAINQWGTDHAISHPVFNW